MRSLRLFLLLIILLPLGGLYPYRSLAQTKSRTLRRLEQERRQLLKKIEEGDKKLQQLRATTQSSEQTLRVVQQQVAQRREVVTLLGNEVSGLQARIDTLSGHIGRLRREEGALLLRYQSALLQLQRIDTHTDPLLFILSSATPTQARERQPFPPRDVEGGPPAGRRPPPLPAAACGTGRARCRILF